MQTPRVLEIQPPLAGLQRSTAYQSQPPFTTYDALNVWPRDPDQGRARMGTRAGLSLITPGPAEAPWRLFETILVKTNDRFAYWADSFQHASLDHWTLPSELTGAVRPTLAGGKAYADSGTAAVAIPAQTGFDATARFRFGIFLCPKSGEYGGTYRLYFGMATGNDTDDSFRLNFTIDADGDWSAQFVERVSGVDSNISTAATGDDLASIEGWLTVEVHGTSAKAYWRGTLIKTVTLGSAVDGTKPAMAFALLPGAKRAQVDQVSLEYYKTSDFDMLRPVLVASQNGLLYRDGFRGELTRSIATRTLASDRRITGADWGGLKFLNDRSEPILSGGDGTLGSGTFSAASVASMATALAAYNLEDLVLVILSETGRGTYVITAASSGLTITGGVSATNAKWWITRSPKIYDPVADGEAILASGTDGAITGGNTFDSATYTDWNVPFAGKLAAATLAKYSLEILSGSTVTARYSISSVSTGTLGISAASDGTGLTWRIVRNDKLILWRATSGRGTVPVGCTAIARHMGSIYLAGDPVEPNEWYKSRNGDPYDWYFEDTDEGAATKGSNGEAYVIRDAVVGMIPYADRYMLFGCRSSFWRLSGDVTAGGSISAIDYTAGMASSTAWCHGENAGQVFVLSPDQGLLATQIDCPTCELVRLSRDSIPRELINIPADVEISMVYDVRNRGVIITLTPMVASEGVMPVPTHWFFDTVTRGYFPMQFADKGHNPVSLLWYPGAGAEDRYVLAAGFNGDVLRFTWTAENDCGNAIAAYVTLGPMMLGQAGIGGGSVADIWANLTADSADVTWSLYVGKRAEDAVRNSVATTGTFRAGVIRHAQPRRSGGAWALKLSGSGLRWCFESIGAQIEPLGMLR